MSSKATTWVGGTVVVALLILVATWFVGVSPVIAATSAAHADADAAEQRNVQLQADLDRLKQQFAELDASKAQLAEIQRQIPTEAQLAEYVRTVQATADATSVTFLGYTAGDPEAVVPVEAPAAAAAPADDAEGEEAEGAAAEEGTAETAPTPAGFVPIEGMVGMSVQLQVVGTPANVAAFVEQVQTAVERLYLVTAFTGVGLAAEEASGGRPVINEGDLELQLTGYLYGLAPLATPTPTEEPTLAPLPPGVPPRMGSSS